MNILVVCQYYWPEPFRLADICEELVSRGHKVSVVTGVPNYPGGDIYEGYRRGKNRRQEKGGVKIARTYTIGRKKNHFFRVLNYYSFAISSKCYVKHVEEDFDVVLAYQASPVMMAQAAVKYAKKHGKKTLLYCMDLWPSSLRAGGIAPGSSVYRAFHRVSEKIYCGVDKIAVSSDGFRGYFRETFGIPEEKLVYLPQYADNSFELPKKEKTDSLDLVFAGNIGKAQNIETIILAANELKDKKHIKWNIIGDGSSLGELKELAAGFDLDNVFFHGYMKADALEKAYSAADAMLMTLTPDPVISLTLPLKVMSYMGSGRPIIAAVDGAAAEEIKKAGCGYVVPAGDYKGLANAVLEFEACDDRGAFCDAAKAHYTKWFRRDRFMDEIEAQLLSLCQED